MGSHKTIKGKTGPASPQVGAETRKYPKSGSNKRRNMSPTRGDDAGGGKKY